LNDAWTEIKQRGSAHYKTGQVEVIDLLKDLTLHPDITALQAKALMDNIKYSYRQLQRGYSKSDCDKIKHYTDMVIVIGEEVKP
jgi:hypothetical protein